MLKVGLPTLMQALKRLHKWDFNNFNTSYFLPSGQTKKEEPCKGFFSPKVLILYFPEKPQLLVKKDGKKSTRWEVLDLKKSTLIK